MENRFTDSEDFEDWLQQESNSFRMRPSDKVWNAISKDLNKKRRRFFAGFSLSVLVLSVLGYFTVDLIKDNDTVKPEQQPASASQNTILKNATVPTGVTTEAKVIPLNKDNTSAIALQKKSNQESIVVAMPSRRRASPFNQSSAAVITNNEVASEPASAFQAQPVDTYTPEATSGSVTDLSLVPDAKAEVAGKLPLTIESVTNAYRQPHYRKRLSYQFYFTPAVSYRKLTENKSYLRASGAAGNAIYINPSIYDVNNAVTHKPAFGFEVGMNAKYPIARNIKLTAGAQLNINRYEIKAYNTAPLMTTITLNEPDNHASSIKAFSKYSNVKGYSEEWLQNFYAQVSLPVGAEINLTGNHNYRLGLATTIQPTYVIGDRSYVLSTDYENYASMPSLVRHWNVNTGVNAFIAYSSGKLNWQVGPQVRYQLLSSFISQYPVKENLFEYGLRVGVSLRK